MTSPPLRTSCTSPAVLVIGAVFFVGGGGGQDDVGKLRGFRQKQILHDEQVEFAQAIRSRRRRMFSPDLRRRRRARAVVPWPRPRASRAHPGRAFPEASRPKARRIFRARFDVRNRGIAGEHVRQQAHVRSAARIRVIAERHVARLPGQGRAEFHKIADRRARELRAENDDDVCSLFRARLLARKGARSFPRPAALRRPRASGQRSLRGPPALPRNPWPCAAA